MRDALKTYLALATGVTDLTRQAAVAAARALVSQGEATAEQVTGLAEDLLTHTRQNREAVVALVSAEVDRALARVGLASTDEVVALTERVRELERQLQAAAAATAGAAAARQAAGTRSTSQDADAEATPAGKAPAGKAPAGKAPAKKAPAKKAPAKEAPAKEAPAKNAPAKKAPAKNAPAKNAPAEKAPAKQAPSVVGPAVAEPDVLPGTAPSAGTAQAAAGTTRSAPEPDESPA